MEESFIFFNEMRLKMVLDSQIKIAYIWRKIVKMRAKQAADELFEQERLKAEKLQKKKKKGSISFGHKAKRPKIKNATTPKDRTGRDNKDLEETGVEKPTSQSTANSVAIDEVNLRKANSEATE